MEEPPYELKTINKKQLLKLIGLFVGFLMVLITLIIASGGRR